MIFFVMQASSFGSADVQQQTFKNSNRSTQATPGQRQNVQGYRLAIVTTPSGTTTTIRHRLRPNTLTREIWLMHKESMKLCKRSSRGGLSHRHPEQTQLVGPTCVNTQTLFNTAAPSFIPGALKHVTLSDCSKVHVTPHQPSVSRAPAA